MVFGSIPPHPWLVAAGVAWWRLRASRSGSPSARSSPHELEGVLVLIGVVGVQLTLDSTDLGLLPFWGAQRVIGYSGGVDGSIGIAPAVAVAYSLALLAAAAYIVHRRAPAIRAVGSLSSIT